MHQGQRAAGTALVAKPTTVAEHVSATRANVNVLGWFINDALDHANTWLSA